MNHDQLILKDSGKFGQQPRVESRNTVFFLFETHQLDVLTFQHSLIEIQIILSTIGILKFFLVIIQQYAIRICNHSLEVMRKV